MTSDLKNMVLVSRMATNDVDSRCFQKFQDNIRQNRHIYIVPPGWGNHIEQCLEARHMTSFHCSDWLTKYQHLVIH